MSLLYRVQCRLQGEPRSENAPILRELCDLARVRIYANTLLGWDVSIYTCSTTPIPVTSATQIAVRFVCGSTETGIMRLVQSDTGTAEDILTKAQTEGSYIDLPLQWIYAADYVTTLTPCDGVTAGSYYLVWVGRSNNSQPKIQSVAAIS